jgi:hypothetical protein
MTSASVWPVAQVAASHARICAMLMTGIGMSLKRGKFFTTAKAECRSPIHFVTESSHGFHLIEIV